MLLAVDVGNTNITLAVYDGQRLAADWRVSADTRRTCDEYTVLISGLAQQESIALHQITDFALCSVIPSVIDPLLSFARKTIGISDPFLLTSSSDLGFSIRYQPPTDVGADRLANAIAAHALYPGPVIVVDMGTATTFDAIAEDGDYLGGAIAPGMEVSLEALISKTAQLRRVRLTPPPAAVGTTTVESLQSGMIYGYAGQVDGIVTKFQEEMGGNAYVVATGGLAELVAPYSHSIREVSPTLTLEGLRLAYAGHRNKD